MVYAGVNHLIAESFKMRIALDHLNLKLCDRIRKKMFFCRSPSTPRSSAPAFLTRPDLEDNLRLTDETTTLFRQERPWRLIFR